jgi:hypothetical protein
MAPLNAEILRDLIGLYLNPPDKTIVFSVGEKSRSKKWVAPTRFADEIREIWNDDTRL